MEDTTLLQHEIIINIQQLKNKIAQNNSKDYNPVEDFEILKTKSIGSLESIRENLIPIYNSTVKHNASVNRSFYFIYINKQYEPKVDKIDLSTLDSDFLKEYSGSPERFGIYCKSVVNEYKKTLTQLQVEGLIVFNQYQMETIKEQIQELDNLETE